MVIDVQKDEPQAVGERNQGVTEMAADDEKRWQGPRNREFWEWFWNIDRPLLVDRP
jgi:hypothetical protein